MNTLLNAQCSRCTLDSAHPMSHIDEKGVCGPCRRVEDPTKVEARKQRLLGEMEATFSSLQGRAGVHAVVAFSGGKDSSWTLLQLRRRYGLRLRAVTLDNGFLSSVALQNAALVAEAADAEHVVVRPRIDLMRALFAEVLWREPFSKTALTRASGVCNACIAVVKAVCLRETLAHRVPVLAWGWSPGQAPTNSAWLTTTPELLQATVDKLRGPLLDALGEEVLPWFPPSMTEEGAGPLPILASPLALLDYDEARVLRELHEIGWKRPQDVDPNSSNCRLNSLGNFVHLSRHGFHPYALELAGLVRSGVLTREEAKARLEESSDPRLLAQVADELGLPEELRQALSLPGGS